MGREEKLISTQAQRYSEAFSDLIFPKNKLKIITKEGIVSQISEDLIRFSSHLIKSILNDIPCCSSSIILIPDVSKASVDHVLSIITTSITSSSSKEIQNIKDTARMLGIDLINLLPDDVHIKKEKHDNDGVLVNIIKHDDDHKNVEVKTELREYFEEYQEEYKPIEDNKKLIESKHIKTDYHSVNVHSNVKDKREHFEGASILEEVNKNQDSNYNFECLIETSDLKKSNSSDETASSSSESTEENIKHIVDNMDIRAKFDGRERQKKDIDIRNDNRGRDINIRNDVRGRQFIRDTENSCNSFNFCNERQNKIPGFVNFNRATERDRDVRKFPYERRAAQSSNEKKTMNVPRRWRQKDRTFNSSKQNCAGAGKPSLSHSDFYKLSKAKVMAELSSAQIKLVHVERNIDMKESVKYFQHKKHALEVEEG